MSPVFDTYWRFAHARQEIYLRRISGADAPWADDPILNRYRFTNAYRAADRVSQFLIRSVIYSGSQAPRDVVFRTLLFKFFNKISTWQALDKALDLDRWADFDAAACCEELKRLRTSGNTLYSAAYVIPPPRLGKGTKPENHVALLQYMMTEGLVESLEAAASLEHVYGALRSFPSIGNFLAFQFAIDLNYSGFLTFEESEFVVPGPGARDGIRKCFGAGAAGIETEIIRWMAETQEDHFSRLGLPFCPLGGRPLQLIDIQNLFCEVDKYARVAHPEVAGYSGRMRIKQVFRRLDQPLPVPWFPPRWGINQLCLAPELVEET